MEKFKGPNIEHRPDVYKRHVGVNLKCIDTRPIPRLIRVPTSGSGDVASNTWPPTHHLPMTSSDMLHNPPQTTCPQETATQPYTLYTRADTANIHRNTRTTREDMKCPVEHMHTGGNMREANDCMHILQRLAIVLAQGDERLSPYACMGQLLLIKSVICADCPASPHSNIMMKDRFFLRLLSAWI